MHNGRIVIISLAAIATATAGCQPRKPAPSTQPGLAESSFREPTHRVEVMTRPNNPLSASLVGKKCRVQIRRDALGMAGNAPAGTDSRWASESSVTGAVAEVTDQWIVVDISPKRRVLIPQASILMIEMMP